ncbi:MAG: PaaI family thioesterase [Burkholderiaceae bacterium]|nr:PaaI family thioesterase [Burkholderiaceae bacterium]
MTAVMLAAEAPTVHDTRVVPSPYRDMLGLRVVEWEADVCVVEIPLRDSLRNFSGSVAGPVVAAAMDMAAVLSGCHTPSPLPTRRAVTLALSVAFVAPTFDDVVRARAVKVGGGKNVFTSTVTATDGSGTTIATGQATCRYVAQEVFP